VLDIILKIIGALGGVIGTILGVYNFVHARRKESRELKEKETAKEQEQRVWKFYSDFLPASREGLVLKPDVGSEQHMMAEGLVAKGMLIRLPNMGGYAVPGQSYLVGTGSANNKE